MYFDAFKAQTRHVVAAFVDSSILTVLGAHLISQNHTFFLLLFLSCAHDIRRACHNEERTLLSVLYIYVYIYLLFLTLSARARSRCVSFFFFQSVLCVSKFNNDTLLTSLSSLLSSLSTAAAAGTEEERERERERVLVSLW